MGFDFPGNLLLPRQAPPPSPQGCSARTLGVPILCEHPQVNQPRLSALLCAMGASEKAQLGSTCAGMFRQCCPGPGYRFQSSMPPPLAVGPQTAPCSPLRALVPSTVTGTTITGTVGAPCRTCLAGCLAHRRCQQLVALRILVPGPRLECPMQ